MQLKMYSIRDAKGAFYHAPFYKRSHGEAERDFAALVRDPKSQLSQFPEDYDLFYVGNYDDQTGLVKPLETPHHVVKAIDTKPQ